MTTDFFTTIVKRAASPDGELADAIFTALKDSTVYAQYPGQIETLLSEAAEEQGVDGAVIAVLEILCALRKTVPNSSSVYLGLDEYLRSKDLIFQLCALQIIIQNADSQHDFELLTGIIEDLVERLPYSGDFILNDEPIYCKAIQLFSNLLRVNTTNWAPFMSKLIPGITCCLKEKSNAQQDAVVLTACMLANPSTASQAPVELFLEAFSSSDPSVRAACLHAASIAFSEVISEGAKDQILAKGLGAMGNKSPYENLQELCCSGLKEVQEASYRCLGSMLSNHRMAEGALANSDLFLFITNRFGDSSPLGLQAKYDIISQLLNKEWAQQVLNEPMHQSLASYLSKGVYYQEATPVVAMQP